MEETELGKKMEPPFTGGFAVAQPSTTKSVVDRIKISKEFFVLGSGEWITAECQIMEGDDWMQVVQEIKQKMISMYGGGNGNGNTRLDDYIEDQNAHKYKQPIINRAYERMEVLIGNCETLEQLSEHKEFVNKNPDLMTAYSNKLKELTKNITV